MKGTRIPRAVTATTAKEAPEKPKYPASMDVPEGCLVIFVVLAAAIWRTLGN